MSVNRREFLSIYNYCVAAYSVWIPKPLLPQKNSGKLFLAEQRQKHLTQGDGVLDSLVCKDIGTSRTN
jgi:hypothetical protein